MGNPRMVLGRNYIHEKAHGKTYALYGLATHAIGSGHATWTLDEDEQEASVLVISGTGDAGVKISLAAAKPGKIYILYNASSQTVTFTVGAGTDTTIASTKFGIYYCNTTAIVEVFEST